MNVLVKVGQAAHGIGQRMADGVRRVFWAVERQPRRVVDAFDPYADHPDYREEWRHA